MPLYSNYGTKVHINLSISTDSSLLAVSPIDGRYASKTKELQELFSEYALIKYRVWVEIQYFSALCAVPLPQLSSVTKNQLEQLSQIHQRFSLADAARIKEIERTTNHDVKAVEYFLKEKLPAIGLEAYQEFIHFGLTSQDINNTALPRTVKDAVEGVYTHYYSIIFQKLQSYASQWAHIPMLARTHGQPASPTTLGKEIQVFVERLAVQWQQLQTITFKAKFGGATGNLNAHYVAYPDVDWHQFADNFVANYLGLERSHYTTQIEHYDNLAALFHALMRINTILIDLCRDFWTYISMEYFRQKVVENEVGSSAMPHKVNPIDFENAEGNLGLANAIFLHLADKLPISRLQRDLTDSTVSRNVGVPFAHILIAFQSLAKGLDKLVLNEAQLRHDLEQNWMVVSEAIQTILRREGYEQPYEALKALTRGKAQVGEAEIRQFIENLSVKETVKQELRKISPYNYIGKNS